MVEWSKCAGGKGGWRINGHTVKFCCSDNGQKTDGFRVVVDIAMSRALSNNMRVEFEFLWNGNFLTHNERREGKGEKSLARDVHGRNSKLGHLLRVSPKGCRRCQ